MMMEEQLQRGDDGGREGSVVGLRGGTSEFLREQFAPRNLQQRTTWTRIRLGVRMSTRLGYYYLGGMMDPWN